MHNYFSTNYEFYVIAKRFYKAKRLKEFYEFYVIAKRFYKAKRLKNHTELLRKTTMNFA